MPERPLRFQTSDRAEIAVDDLERGIDGWLMDGQVRMHSPRTTELHRLIAGQLVWFLRDQGHVTCGTRELREFLVHLAHGHETPTGRWGTPGRRPVRPRTVDTYRGRLRTLFRWLVNEGLLDASPMAPIPPPLARADQVRPFTPEQVEALIAAARRTVTPRRDEAIVLVLLDTGMRVSELCGLTLADVDLTGRRCVLTGKGNKQRTVYYSPTTGRAIWQYLRTQERPSGGPLFTSVCGRTAGRPLTRSGVQQLVERLGAMAHLSAARCSPHTFRHTFAVEWLKAGGNQFSLMEVLGHTTVRMTARYVHLAAADVEAQSRRFSPVERMAKR